MSTRCHVIIRETDDSNSNTKNVGIAINLNK